MSSHLSKRARLYLERYPLNSLQVHAVFKPELRVYKDVIVFPSKGSVSLASKLSGYVCRYSGRRVATLTAI